MNSTQIFLGPAHERRHGRTHALIFFAFTGYIVLNSLSTSSTRGGIYTQGALTHARPACPLPWPLTARTTCTLAQLLDPFSPAAHHALERGCLQQIACSPLLPLSWTRPHTGLRLEPGHTHRDTHATHTHRRNTLMHARTHAT